MLNLKIEKSFNKDLKKSQKSGNYSKNDFKLLKQILTQLQNQEFIDAKYKQHPLKGNLKNFEAIHIKYDWVLIYQISNLDLILVMLGTHAQVYKKF